MVLDDFSLSKRGAPPRQFTADSSSSGERGPWPASPKDRLAANVADCVVFLPILALAVAPFSRQASEARLIGAEELWSSAVLSALIAGFLVLLAYQTLTVMILGATPGKFVLGLRVVSISTPNYQRPRPIEAFLRALFWCLEACMLGIPWLAVFSNERRRPMHDRIADTAVITYSKKRRAVPAEPTLAEMSIASGFQSATLAVFAMVLATQIGRLQVQSSSLELQLARFEDEGRLCPEVREAIEKSSVRRLDSIKDRLETTLTLYISGAVENICLEAEAELALWRNQETPLAYFAKGVALEDSEKASPYFEKACDGSKNTDVCKAMTLLQDMIARDNRDEVERDRETENLRERDVLKTLAAIDEKSPDYLRALAVRYLIDKRDDETALSYLDSANHFDGARGFAAQERAKTLWRLGRKSEGRAAMISAFFLLDPEARLNLAQWFCRQEVLADGCSAEGITACQQVREAVNDNEIWLHRPEVASAFIHSVQCAAKEEKEALESIKERLPFRSGKRLVDVFLNLERNKRKEAVRELKDLLKGFQNTRSVFFTDASVILASIASRPDEIEQVQGAWNRMDERSEGWLTVGRSLLKNLVRLGVWDAAVATGLKLQQENRFDAQSLQLTLVAAKKAGRTQVEKALIESMTRQPSSLQKGSQK